MLALGLILLFLAYTVGIAAIVMELICYKRKIEYIETIILSFCFLLLIFSISISTIGELINNRQVLVPQSILLLSVVGIALMTPLNIYAERQLKLPLWLRYTLYAVAALLALLCMLRGFLNLGNFAEWVVYGCLAVSVIFSMYKLRTSKPKIHIAHQDKLERTMAIAIVTLLPVFLVLEFYWKTEIPITISVFFIILGISKIIDNTKRLSLFSSSNERTMIPRNLSGLTPREQEVAKYLVEGATYSKIAEDLFISMPTVKTHVSNIYKKVGVKNKMELFYALTN